MRRSPVLISVAAVVLLGVVVAGRVGPLAGAQEGTPPAGAFEIAPGVTAEGLAFAVGQEAPSLYRLTFAPGVTYAVQPAPDISLAYGESGALVFGLDVPVTVTRAGATAAPGEPVAAGTEFTLQPGDYFVVPPLAAGEIRNEGDEPASVVVASIIPGGRATPEAGTPAP